MREADARACGHIGDVKLMRRAGAGIASVILRVFPAARRVVAFAGRGNNGGDAFAALADLPSSIERTVFAAPSLAPSAARVDAQARAEAAGVRIAALPATVSEAQRALDGAHVALDGLLGSGARPAPGAALIPVIDALNAASTHVLAIDVPTGIDATTGARAEHAVRARTTVTLGALKLGLLLDPARANVGTLYLDEIGIADDVAAASGDRVEALGPAEFHAIFPRRADDADKRSAGAVLVIAGSAQFPGAAVLCAQGAARAGAGYVTVATTAEAAPALRTHLIEQVVVTHSALDVAAAIEQLLDLTNHASAVAIGPGLALDAATGDIVRGFLAKLTAPFVVDASALFHLAKHLSILRGKRCVITPHAGEFGRISGEGTIAAGAHISRLRSFVARTTITTLLKGRSTLIDDGSTLHVNLSGTSALATAGTGDVLTGMIATLLAQGLAPVDAARAAAYWHGLAGHVARDRRSIGVVAGDLPEALATAYFRADFASTADDTGADFGRHDGLLLRIF